MLEVWQLEEPLTQSLKDLCLPTVHVRYEQRVDRARQDTLCYGNCLAERMERELEVWRQNRIAPLLRQSKLPLDNNLETFYLMRLPAEVAAQVNAVLDCFFVDRTENVLAFGNPGSGKSHLLCATGQELILQGRQVLFAPCNLLMEELLKTPWKYDALIIDNTGYV